MRKSEGRDVEVLRIGLSEFCPLRVSLRYTLKVVTRLCLLIFS